MIARTPFLAIASAVGVPAICLGLTLLNGGSALAQTSSGNSVAPWFNRNASASGAQPVSAPASANNAVPATANGTSSSPFSKFKARVSSMGQSVKKSFAGNDASTKKVVPKPADNPVSLSTPAKPRADFYISLARIQERAGNATTAVEQYKRALELEPENLAAILALARLYDRQGQLAEAQKYYARATVAHPKEAAAFNDQGLCFARQEKYAEAIVSLRKASELRPDRALYRNNLATVQIEMGQIDAAFQTLAVVHGTAVAHYNVGFLLNRRGETAKALEQFKLAAASDAKFEAAGQWVATLTAKLASEQSKIASEPASASPNTTPQPSGPVINPVVKSDAALASTKPSEPAAKAVEPAAARPAVAPALAGPTVPSAAASTATAAAAMPAAPIPAPAVAVSPMQTPAVATPPAPSLLAGASNTQPASQPLANAPAALTAAPPQSTLAVKERPTQSLRLSPAASVKLSPSTSSPKPIQKTSTEPGSQAVQPRKPDSRPSQPPELVAQRPTRLPPTPDEIQNYAQGATPVDGSNNIVPLPPIDPGHYPASRY